jgi:cysteinyl-tRNA synthetase
LTLDRGGPDGADSDEIAALVAARQAARADRNFAEADRLRDVLTARGIVVEDTAAGPVWRRA